MSLKGWRRAQRMAAELKMAARAGVSVREWRQAKKAARKKRAASAAALEAVQRPWLDRVLACTSSISSASVPAREPDPLAQAMVKQKWTRSNAALESKQQSWLTPNTSAPSLVSTMAVSSAHMPKIPTAISIVDPAEHTPLANALSVDAVRASR